MTRLLKSREALLALAILALIALIAHALPGLRRARATSPRSSTTPSILIILALGQMIGDPDQVHRPVGGRQPRADRHDRRRMLNAAYPGVPVPLILLPRSPLGAALGAVNGLLVWKLGIPLDRRHARHA